MPEKAQKGNLLEKLVPILLFASIVLAFAVGVLWQKVSSLEEGKATSEAAKENQEKTQVAQGPKQGKLSAEEVKNIPPVSVDDHVRGSRKARVFLIEYSDYQCPYCVKFHETTKTMLEDYGDKVALVYRHYPLDAIHPKARPAALASECVAEIGGEDAFWSFTDKMFADQTKNLDDLEGVAAKAGVAKASFKSCFESEKYKDAVEDDFQGGILAGVKGTPGNFVLNDKGEAWAIPGAVPYDNLKKTIDEALGTSS